MGFWGKKGLWLCQCVQLQWVGVFWGYAMSASVAGWVPLQKVIQCTVVYVYINAEVGAAVVTARGEVEVEERSEGAMG